MRNIETYWYILDEPADYSEGALDHFVARRYQAVGIGFVELLLRTILAIPSSLHLFNGGSGYTQAKRVHSSSAAPVKEPKDVPESTRESAHDIQGIGTLALAAVLATGLLEAGVFAPYVEWLPPREFWFSMAFPALGVFSAKLIKLFRSWKGDSHE